MRLVAAFLLLTCAKSRNTSSIVGGFLAIRTDEAGTAGQQRRLVEDALLSEEAAGGEEAQTDKEAESQDDSLKSFYTTAFIVFSIGAIVVCCVVNLKVAIRKALSARGQAAVHPAEFANEAQAQVGAGVSQAEVSLQALASPKEHPCLLGGNSTWVQKPGAPNEGEIARVRHFEKQPIGHSPSVSDGRGDLPSSAEGSLRQAALESGQIKVACEPHACANAETSEHAPDAGTLRDNRACASRKTLGMKSRARLGLSPRAHDGKTGDPARVLPGPASRARLGLPPRERNELPIIQ